MILPPDDATLDLAARALREGGLVVMPTETVYGLAADAEDDRAVAAIYEAKGRPSFNPLILHVAGTEMAERYALLPPLAKKLADAFWPGPLTLVVPRRGDSPLSQLATVGLDTVALRAPAHPVASALLRRMGGGIVAPSANRSGGVSPTLAAHAEKELGSRVAMVIDGGPCRVGLESTVCDATGEEIFILRQGSVTAEELFQATGLQARLADIQNPDAPKSPGMLLRHYAPRLPLRLEAKEIRQGEALLAFGRHGLQGAAAELNLSETGDVKEAAANLFAMLRALDDPRYAGIAVMPVPENGIGAAINDRLRRGASR